ncbi:hypothetical protein D3C78_1133730 [compost metagenome]
MRCGEYGGIGFDAGFEQAFKTGASQWITRFTEQPDGGQAHGRVAVHQLQVGQGQAQRGFNRFIVFARQSLVEEFQLRRFGTFLQVLRGRQTDSAVEGEQLMAGQRGVDQTSQAVVQAQRFGLAIDHQLPLLQGVDQLDTCRIGLRGPGFQQPGLLCGIGRGEIFSVASLYRQRQQQQASDDQAVKGGGHKGYPVDRASDRSHAGEWERSRPD